MFNFINQVGAAIYSFFSALYRRFIQPEPVRELFLAETSPINYEVISLSLIDLSTTTIPPITPTLSPVNSSFELENLVRHLRPPLSFNYDFFPQQATQNPLLRTNITRDVFRENNTPWARWFREENRRQRQQSEAELAVWWRNS